MGQRKARAAELAVGEQDRGFLQMLGDGQELPEGYKAGGGAVWGLPHLSVKVDFGN